MTVTTNAVVCWHVAYLGLAVVELRRADRNVDAEVLAHISPARSSAVNYYGSITVDYDRELAQLDEHGHRPLRTAGDATGPGVRSTRNHGGAEHVSCSDEITARPYELAGRQPICRTRQRQRGKHAAGVEDQGSGIPVRWTRGDGGTGTDNEILADMAEGIDRQQDVTYQAPVGCVDLRAFDDDGNSYDIHACHDCLPWHAEVVVIEGDILVREWHAVGCPQFQQLIRD
ncbi:Tn3 family transposase [Streptomyces microflavus]|uniref:Tn3 family transposase n=1 Tax=Streptomyces microflavus TaxID=1919 RepID=UPI0036480596